MERKVISFRRYSSTADESFKEILNYAPFIRVVCFFNNENFLITPYVPADNSINMVLESEFGDQLHISSCNCGYQGVGPNTTLELLIKLGFDEDKLKSLIYKGGFEIYLDEKEYIYQELCLFDSRLHELSNRKIIHLKNEKIQVNLYNQTVFFNQPEVYGFEDVFIAINQIVPREFEYFIGNSALEAFECHNAPTEFMKHPRYGLDIKKQRSAIIIKSNEFDIFCIIDNQIASSVINTLFSSVSTDFLFEECHLGDLTILTDKTISENNFLQKIQLLKYILFNKNELKQNHRIISLTGGAHN